MNRKIIAPVLCSVFLILMLTSCGSTAASSSASASGSNETLIMGKVTAINGSTVTLALSAQRDSGNGNPNGGSAPSGGGNPNGGPAPSGGSNPNGGPAPSGGSAAPAMPSGSGGQAPGGNGIDNFTLTGESKTITIASSAVISKLSSSASTTSGSVSDISVGDILTVSMSGDTVTAITINMGISSAAATGAGTAPESGATASGT